MSHARNESDGNVATDPRETCGRSRRRAHAPSYAVGMRRASVLVLAALALGACAHSSASSPTATTTSLPAVVAVGPNPSISAQMVCAKEAENDIATGLGVKTIAPPVATWKDHVYSCRYVYAQGTMVLSVKELSRASETTQYFDKLQASLGKSEPFQLGQGGFIAKDGSAVVRKDYKVLRVDVTGLPSKFGKPPSTRSTVAADVAVTVLGCWTGA